MSLNLTKYKLLSFDIYATLIDWESGIFSDLQPLIDCLPADSQFRNRKLILGAYSAHEQTIHQEHPTMLYSDVLKECYRRLAVQLSAGTAGTEIEEEAGTFGQSIGSWPAYPDTVQAMQTLGKHYKLVVLSNVDKASFHRTLTGPLNGVHFDAIYTAQDIGSYKPDLKNFEYLISHVKNDLGVEKEEILHVAQSLTHDHVPAKSIGLVPGVWISRGGGEGKESAMGGSLEVLAGEGKVRLGAVYETLGDFAGAVEEAFAGER
jgi:2-haloalkanoic acid dehalogenase type II